MSEAAGHVFAVPTCIACGARFRAGECPDGCDDRPIDLVTVEDADAAERAAVHGERRAAALRAVLARAVDAPPDAELRDAARAALRTPAGVAPDAAVVVEAWGCLTCGRVDAPRPCLGLCTRTPVPMVDATGFRAAAVRAEHAAREARVLEPAVRQLAWTRPRPGAQVATARALRDAADRALAAQAAGAVTGAR